MIIIITLLLLLLLLLLPLFFAPFFPPVSLALFICLWVSEDGGGGEGGLFERGFKQESGEVSSPVT